MSARLLLRSVAYRPYWLLIAFTLLVAWLTRNKKIAGWKLVPARDPSVNTCHIDNWGGFNPSKQAPEYIFDWCYGVDVGRLLFFAKHMRAYTPEHAAYSKASDFGSNVRMFLWKPTAASSSTAAGVGAGGGRILVNLNITAHSEERTAPCKDRIRGVEVSHFRWNWVEISYYDDILNLVTGHRITAAADVCVVQLLADRA